MQISLIPILAAAAAALAEPAARPSLEQAQAAFGVYDVNTAERLYREVAADAQASQRDRAIANRELARIAWLVDGHSNRARTLLTRSLPGDPDPCPSAYLLGRILNDSSDTPGPLRPLEPYLEPCLETEPGVALEAVCARMLDAAATPHKLRASKAAVALAAWRALPAAAKGGLAGTRLQLAIGLLSRDPAEALAGWQSYFWLEDEEVALPAWSETDSEVRDAFAKGLSAGSTTADQLRLAEVLLRSGFYDEFKQYAADRDLETLARAGDSRWAPFAVYMRLRETLHAEILAHDRLFARKGAGDEQAYEKRLSAILAEAAAALGGDPAKPLGILHQTYGLWGTAPGKSNGVSGIHLGHVVVDNRQQVEQDGRTGTIRFIVIDNMVHNSFSAWLMDGLSAPGGWAEDGARVIQVRPRYLQSIDSLAALASKGAARDRALAEIGVQRPKDRAIAATSPITFLPGVRSRLRLQGIDTLAAAVRRDLKPGQDFDQAVRRAYWDAMIASGITAHEGRHILDQAQFKDAEALGNAELEFRAKLSEIRFAPFPSLALASIYSPLFGGTSGHGIANQRLMGELTAWIRAHRAQIAGYSDALSELEQLDLLTDKQIQAFAEGLDPARTTSRLTGHDGRASAVSTGAPRE